MGCAAFLFEGSYLNQHRKKRQFYGLPCSTVRCDAFFVITTILPCGAVRCFVYGAAVRCGYFFFWDSTVRFCAVLSEAKLYGAVRFG